MSALKLTDKQYRKLIKAYQKGDDSALKKIQEKSNWIVKRVVSHYEGKEKDLINAGQTGLTKATEKFNLSKEYKFLTYATWWIRAAIHKRLRLPLD